jgi:hypothetical protein
MKTKTYFNGLWVMPLIIFLCIFCAQKGNESKTVVNLENTIKSVSFWSDSIGIETSELISMIDRLNESIDSIGYPDAGYKVWLVQGDTVENLRFLIEGSWPNQDIYTTIHNHELYDKSSRDKVLSKLKMVSYYRVTQLK